jgi:hypothetical protein
VLEAGGCVESRVCMDNGLYHWCAFETPYSVFFFQDLRS